MPASCPTSWRPLRTSVPANGRPAPPAQGLIDRRVEITGPVDRKMIINALNSGATQFMADFEDATCPTWDNVMAGQVNMHDAIHRTISFQNPDGKVYKLNEKVAVLLCRPRGLHMDEWHVQVDGEPVSGSLFDFALYFYHNARRSLEIGQGPYFYLPKLESHLEARWWNQVFVQAQTDVRLPIGTIRGTVLIETILAAFEMDEILFELRDHSSGLNCGRWDYIFSFIKKLRSHPQFVLPNRADVTMTTHFMQSYVQLLIQTCHKRGVHAMGGMAAQIPIKGDDAANQAALEKVRKDKLREVTAGHDGTWVAHPALIPIAKAVFDEHMPTPNQLHVTRDDVKVTAADLLSTKFDGKVTEEGVRVNISVGLQYLESWLRGQGCVPIHNLMEDAATAEISRSQLWQWIRYAVPLDGGKTVTSSLVEEHIQAEVASLKGKLGDKYAATKYDEAADVLRHLANADSLEDFLTFPLCYKSITKTTLKTSL
eukprot:Colp12_sorted_trinity150504_noHs@15465